MTDETNNLHFTRLYDTMMQQNENTKQHNENVKNLTVELGQLNVVLQKVIIDNKHRDKRIDDCEESIDTVKKEISEIHRQRTEFREGYLPTLERSKKDHNTQDGQVVKVKWFIAVVLLMVVVSAINKGDAKLWFQGNQKIEVKK